MNQGIHSLAVAKVTLVSLLLFLLQACVTTKTGGSDVKVDHNRALETRVQLTLNYVRQGNRDSARTNLNKAKALSSSDPRIFNAEAMLLQLEGESALAEEAFLKAIKADPNFSSAHNNYGLFLFNRDRLPEAYLEFEIAAGNIEYERRDAALTNLGAVALELDRLDKARASFEHALRLNPGNLGALSSLADLEFAARNYSQAKAYLDRLEQLGKPDAASLWLGIRLERIFGNKDKEASLVLALKNLYPYSEQYLEYKRLLDE